MEIFFYIIIFLIGITFGSFYTLAVYRIPKGEDIVHTHSYCPNCNHKLGFLDLIPVFSYIFLGGKCRYCKKGIRPRYLILEIISGLFFVTVAYLLKLSIYDLQILNVIEYTFLTLYFTFIILIAGIDKENNKINNSVLIYGIIVSIMYMIYLYIKGQTSIYRYVIYLLLLIIISILKCLKSKNSEKNSYIYSILLVILIMCIFTGEYSIFVSAIALVIYYIFKYLSKNKEKNKYNKLGFLLSISNIVNFIILMYLRGK